jgi:hypothetical protein
MPIVLGHLTSARSYGKMAVQIATEKSRGNTTVTVPVHPEFAESLRAARAAKIIGPEVFSGKLVLGRVLPMNKKAWAEVPMIST